MYGPWRFEISKWRTREWGMTAMAFVVLCAALLACGYVFAGGATADVMRVRFGGDSERTRVVVDLAGTARGTVVETGSGGRVVLTS